jgi:hypothetical protein
MMPLWGWSQSELSNYHIKKISVSDTNALDSLSVIPSSVSILELDSNQFDFDFSKNRILYLDSVLFDSLTIQYRTFPIDLNHTFSQRDSTENILGILVNPYSYTNEEETIDYRDLFDEKGLNKNGSISRGVNFGNNRDLSISSNLNLQLSGQVQGVEILAAISDNNIPIQPQGNTQQLQDFDRVFVQFKKDDHRLIAGDFSFQENDDVFLKLNKKVQGLGYQGTFKYGNQTIESEINGALSRGKFSRNYFFATEGNQGPYQLTGAENEAFIIVLSGTERVYIDGKLMQRGMDADYVIDYNTGELTFTSNQLITKDKRIAVEFQYAAQSYSRTLFNSGNTITWGQKTKVHINLYSEQDMRGQQLQQTLNEEEIAFLSEIGDSVNQAVVPSIDTVGFSNNLVLYQVVDTTINGTDYTFFRQSFDEQLAIYQLNFSNVGLNNGNYILAQSVANGRVYEWVPPINGIPQGRYEPVRRIVTPKQQQMFTAALEHDFSKDQKLFLEAALSNTNQNLYSDLNKSDDQGIALFGKYKFKKELGKKEKGLEWKGKQTYQLVTSRFRQIERFRTVEFQRDWNLNDLPDNIEHWATFQTSIVQTGKERVSVESSIINRPNEYNGWKNGIEFNIKPYESLSAQGAVSYLFSEGISTRSNFLKQKLKLKQQISSKYYLQFIEEQEQNILENIALDSLLGASLNFQIIEGEFGRETDILKTAFSYQYRIDDLPKEGSLVRNTIANNYSFSSNYKGEDHQIELKTTYRELDVIDSLLVNQRDERTILNRLDIRNNWLKGALRTNTFLELGTGNELRRSFSYVEVVPGQGTHTWIDYNGDGKQQFNEFEIAEFEDQKQYIRVSTNTNEFITTYNNQLNHTLSFFPSKIFNREKKWQKIINRFSNQFLVSISEKNVKNNKGLIPLPFARSIADSNLISTSSNIRNTLYFNRSSPKFGMNYTIGNTTSKSLLVQGLEGRALQQHLIETRWRFIRKLSLILNLEYQEKTRSSELFDNNEYLIQSYNLGPTLSFQPNTKLRWNINSEIKSKQNLPEFGGEYTLFQSAGTEVTYASSNRGRFQSEFNFIQTFYFADLETNSPIQFDMLEGLQPGSNYTWNVNYQHNFKNNLQANVRYEGRASETAPTVHTASVQVQLLF